MRSPRTSLLCLTAALASLVFAVQPAAASTSSSSSAGWLVRCTTVHTRSDDPIMHAGMPGMSHLHDFIGNPTTSATSTYASMVAAPPSGCSNASDTAGYWVPALYRNGVRVAPNGAGTRQQIYYRANNLRSGTHITAFPPDFRMITGNPAATSTAANPKLGSEIYWGCSDNSTGKLVAPPASCATGIVTLHFGFPNCWDGVQTHANDTAHVVFPKNGSCPAAYPLALPRVIERFEYPVGPDTGTITLASGTAASVHADFWNTWQQARLVSLVDQCLNASINCGKPTR